MPPNSRTIHRAQRYTSDEDAMIAAAAATVGVGFSEFVRRGVLPLARRIIEETDHPTTFAERSGVELKAEALT